MKNKIELESNGKQKPFKRTRKGNKNRKSRETFNSPKVNDVSWYAQNPLLLKMSTVVNFLKRLGSDMGILQNGIKSEIEWRGRTFKPYPTTIPGICVLGWMPTPGVSTNPEAPINKAASKFFTALRLKNMSTSVYDAVDVIFYFLSCDSAYAFYGFMTMVYAHLTNYSFVDSYTPKCVIESMNVDYDDVVMHMAEFSFFINKVQSALSVLRVPKSIAFIARHLHMSAQIYQDTPSEKSQKYIFVPDFLYKYDATTPKLTPVLIGRKAEKLKFSDIKIIMEDLLSTILPDEDTNIIAADVQKYLDRDYWTVNPIDWGTKLKPVFSKEMLWQIHNANFLPYTSISGAEITQQVTANLDTILYWNPHFVSNEPAIGLKRIIDSENEEPTAAEVIESTRLMFTVKNFSKLTTARGYVGFDLGSCGSEILTGVKVVQMKNDGTFEIRPVNTFINMTYSSTVDMWSFGPRIQNAVVDYGTDLYSIVALSAFSYRPITYLTYVEGSDTEWEMAFCGIVSPIDNYAVIDDVQLNAMNEQCLLSQFDLGTII